MGHIASDWLIWGALFVAWVAVAAVLYRREKRKKREIDRQSSSTRGAVDVPTTALRRKRSRRTPTIYEPYGAVVIIANVVLLGTVGWWALVGVVPLDTALFYVYFWPGIPVSED